MAIQPSEKTWDYISERVAERKELYATGESRAVEVEIDREEPATCSVGVSGVDIDPYGNVQACMHLQESAGNLHNQSIEEIWNNSPLFLRARGRAVAAAKAFGDNPLRQLGAPLFCLAVEENCAKTCTGGGCGRRHS